MKLIHTLLLLAVSCASYAAEPSVANRQMASNYYAYPYPELPLPELTDAPQGYEPFHIEHYGRMEAVGISASMFTQPRSQ